MKNLKYVWNNYVAPSAIIFVVAVVSAIPTAIQAVLWISEAQDLTRMYVNTPNADLRALGFAVLLVAELWIALFDGCHMRNVMDKDKKSKETRKHIVDRVHRVYHDEED